MMPGILSNRSTFAHAVERMGYLRLLPRGHRDSARQVEWLHFVVRAGDWDLLVNFSVHDAGERALTGHVVLLLRRGDGDWEGDADRLQSDEVSMSPGRIRLRIGDSSVAFDGVFRIAAACRRRNLSVELRLEPRCFPCLAHNLGGLHWFVLPRLSASGVIRLGDEVIRIDGAPAYHDHNWGLLDDRGVAWEWVCMLHPGAWNVVLVRMLDAARHDCTAAGLLVWQGAHRRRGFRGTAMSFMCEGLLRPQRCLRVPRSVSLLDAGCATDVPATARIEAHADDDRLSGQLVFRDVARVLIPRPNDLGTQVINEVAGHLVLAGQLGGQSVAIDAPAFAEFARPA